MPRNNFPLDEEAKQHLLIAGGIGITLIMSMVAELQRAAQTSIPHAFGRTNGFPSGSDADRR